MRRKLKNLKNKQGHSENGAPRALIDLALYRERRRGWMASTMFDSEYGGFSWATRPTDQAISLRNVPTSSSGPTAS